MNLTELMMLARSLERAVYSQFRSAAPGASQATPAEMLIASEVFRHAPLSIGELATRTGFVQSHVSNIVVRLAERGQVVIATDSADRRRTLVSPDPHMFAEFHRAAINEADPLIAEVLGESDKQRVEDVINVLELLYVSLQAREAGEHSELKRVAAASG